MLVINVTGDPAFVSARTRCPVHEIAIAVPSYAPEAVLSTPEAFGEVVLAGRKATADWLNGPEGVAFLANARVR